jgi:hypothetical protein
MAEKETKFDETIATLIGRIESAIYLIAALFLIVMALASFFVVAGDLFQFTAGDAGIDVIYNALNDLLVVLIVVIANSVQNAMVGGDQSLAGGLISALTLLLTNRALTYLLDRFPAFRTELIGDPVVLVSDGCALERPMKQQCIECEELMAALREHGVADLEDVRLAVLEVDGEISVVPKQGGTVHRTRRRFRGLRSS